MNVTRRPFILLGLLTCAPLACGPSTLLDPASEESSSEVTTEPGTSDPSTTQSTDTEASTETETGEDSMTFVPDGNDDAPFDCDMLLQDCPEGEKCVHTGDPGDFGHVCVPVTGSQAAGDPCVYGGAGNPVDDCDADSVCWNVVEVEGEEVGTCVPFCSGTYDSPECPPEHSCLISSEATIVLCQPTCDPLIQDCNEGQGCYWDFQSVFTCVPTTQDLPLGEPCGFINDCAAGLICLNTEVLPTCDGSACCGTYCDLQQGDAPCEAAMPGTVCTAFFEEGMELEGFENVGVCLVPGA